MSGPLVEINRALYTNMGASLYRKVFMANYIQEGPTCELAPAKRLSISEELQHRRNKLIQELAEVDAAIVAFQKNPEIEQCLTQLSRIGIYR